MGATRQGAEYMASCREFRIPLWSKQAGTRGVDGTAHVRREGEVLGILGATSAHLLKEHMAQSA